MTGSTMQDENVIRERLIGFLLGIGLGTLLGAFLGPRAEELAVASAASKSNALQGTNVTQASFAPVISHRQPLGGS